MQAGLCLSCLQTHKNRFSRVEAHIITAFLAREKCKHINLNCNCKLFILGYNGWFPVNIPVRGWGTEEESNTAGNQQDENGLNRVGGGLEITVKFAHHDDRERVIHAARGVGWSPIDIDVEQDGWQSEG